MSDAFLSSKFIVACVFVLIWVAEGIFPYAQRNSHRLLHAVWNLTLTGVNALVTALFSAILLVNVAHWAEVENIGLLRLMPLPSSLTTVTSIFLLDAWMYIWHRSNHELPLLWRFHRVHHSDMDMDVTTALRFHPGEILLSGLLRAAVIPVLGLSLQHVLLYDVLLLPVIFLHHSNLHLPELIDRILRIAVTTPALHRVHHSRLMIEANSNYGTIFSFWDRLARTFCLRSDGTRVEVGVEGLGAHQTLIDLLRTPFIVPSSAKEAWSHAAHVRVMLTRHR